VAGTYDGKTARIYVDGQLAAMRSLSLASASDTTGLSVGADINGADRDKGERHFIGLLDDVLLYNRPLEHAEIAALAGR
jgi:hypothetical protein